MQKANASVIAAGDLFITRRIAEDGYEGFDELTSCIKSYDARFVNLEMTFHNDEGVPAAVSGGTWAMTDPVMLDDTLRMGFNLFNTANNHSGDYSSQGVSATIRHMKERNMVFAGTGNNLEEASAAAYLETPGARIAMIGVCSTFGEEARAGGQSGRIKGRPGLNPLRYRTEFHVDAENFAMAQKLAKVTGVNAYKEFLIGAGYSMPFAEGTLPFGDAGSFVLDSKNETWTIPNAEDMKRIMDEIREAKRQADIVLVSYHTHEFRDGDEELPAMFTETFARACIDAGADVFLGHGPHRMQGIECYKGKVIFYSIGNFLFETETISLQPFDAFINRKLPPDMKVGAYMDERSKNGTVGYAVIEDIWRAVMAGLQFQDGKLKEVRLIPITLGMHERRSVKGLPKLSHDEKTLEHMRELSMPYGTRILIENGEGIVLLPEVKDES